MTPATIRKTPALQWQKQIGFGKDERRVRGFSDRRSRGDKVEDVLDHESRQKKYQEGKGGEKNVTEKEITHKHYKEAPLKGKQYMHKMKILRSKGHEMYGMCMNKISISPFDTK